MKAGDSTMLTACSVMCRVLVMFWKPKIPSATAAGARTSQALSPCVLHRHCSSPADGVPEVEAEADCPFLYHTSSLYSAFLFRKASCSPSQTPRQLLWHIFPVNVKTTQSGKTSVWASQVTTFSVLKQRFLRGWQGSCESHAVQTSTAACFWRGTAWSLFQTFLSWDASLQAT